MCIARGWHRNSQMDSSSRMAAYSEKANHSIFISKFLEWGWSAHQNGNGNWNASESKPAAKYLTKHSTNVGQIINCGSHVAKSKFKILESFSTCRSVASWMAFAAAFFNPEINVLNVMSIKFPLDWILTHFGWWALPYVPCSWAIAFFAQR